MKKSIIFIGVLLLIIAVFVAGCTSNSPASTATSSTITPIAHYKVGNSVSDAKQKLTIEKVTFQDAPTYMAATGYQMVVNYSIRNLQTDKTLSIYSGLSEFDSNGNSYHASYTTFNGDSILPGETRRGSDEVNVPKTASGFNIRYTLDDGTIAIYDV